MIKSSRIWRLGLFQVQRCTIDVVAQAKACERLGLPVPKRGWLELHPDRITINRPSTYWHLRMPWLPGVLYRRASRKHAKRTGSAANG